MVAVSSRELKITSTGILTNLGRILIDDVDVTGKTGGDGYKNYGIGPEGAIVVVRPDGYVGLVGPFDLHGVSELGDYFKAFMKA